ncbi:MAG: aminopeptidase [Gammaproteobacteria bacterium]
MFNKTILTRILSRILPRILLLSCIFQLTACSTLGYIAHTSSGHLKLMSDRQPISSLLEDENIDQVQKNKFKRFLIIREFASSHLHLPDNKSYTSYVDLDRDYVTWVVFATPQLSLQAESWCFWVVGCVPYRGYYDQSKAQQFANQLKLQQLEVYIAPVPAYSTLGWFSDPLLSSMLDRGELVTAEYIFHELAHQQLYIKNDTSFNEAFASAIAQLGVIAWLEAEKKPAKLQRYLQSIQEKKQLYVIVEDFRQQLVEIYSSSLARPEKLRLKQEAFVSYEKQVVSKLEQWEKLKKYRQWLIEDMNNAKLNAFSTYQALVPDFILLFEACNKNYDEFYRVIESTQRLSDQQRIEFLHSGKCRRVEPE